MSTLAELSGLIKDSFSISLKFLTVVFLDEYNWLLVGVN